VGDHETRGLIGAHSWREDSSQGREPSVLGGILDRVMEYYELASRTQRRSLEAPLSWRGSADGTTFAGRAGGIESRRLMSIDVEANLKIPSLTIKTAGEPDKRINNSSLRLIKRVTLDAIPKAGDTMRLSTRVGKPFEATVSRVDWDEGKNLFVVACSYARRSITADEHAVLLTDPDWRVNQLP